MSRLKFSEHTVEDFDKFLERFTGLIESDLAEHGDDEQAYVAAHKACGSTAKFEAYSVYVAAKQGI